MERKANAMIHSLKEVREVVILSENGPNNVTALYEGNVYSAIRNDFVGLYYVDNLYGFIRQAD